MSGGFSKEELDAFEEKRGNLLDVEEEKDTKGKEEEKGKEEPQFKFPERKEEKPAVVHVSKEEMAEMIKLRGKINRIYQNPLFKKNFLHYKRPNLMDYTLDELQAEYGNAQNIARGGAGGGMITQGYFLTNQTIETMGVRRGLPLQNLTKNASLNPSIMTNLQLLEIEYSSDQQMSPAMALLYASLGNGYSTYMMNKNSVNLSPPSEETKGEDEL